MLQFLVIILTLFGAVCSMIAAFKAQPLIPIYQYKFRAIQNSTLRTFDSIQKLVKHIREQIYETNNSKIEISALLNSKLIRVEESIDFSKKELEKDIGNIFNESRNKASIRIFYFLAFVSIFIAMLLQAIIVFENLEF